MSVLAKGKTRTGRLWTYVRDDRPFAGSDPPAAVFFYAPDRGGGYPDGNCGPLPWEGETGPSPARMRVAGALRPSTP